MSYKEKFNAARDKAHTKAAADKIRDALAALRAKIGNSPTAPRRWVWELVQNAKDVYPEGGVKIRIELDLQTNNPHVSFRHNGRPFSAEDIRFLIEQVSTKSRSKDDTGKRKKTGKFGTGFLATHLLSEVVRVEGVAKEDTEAHTKFEFVLDRSSDDTDEIIEAMRHAQASMEDLDTRPPYPEYLEGAFNTAFHYSLADNESTSAALAGIDDLQNCLPYSLTFVDEIDSIEFSDFSPIERCLRDPNSPRQLSGDVSLTTILEKIGGVSCSATIAKLTTGFTSIAIPVKKEGGTITILPIPAEIPRLFCEFPLIGTEKFPFPAIINNPNFNPTEPRDGIFLTTVPPPRKNPESDENKLYMREAVELYFKLLRHAAENGWGNLHLLAQIPSGESYAGWLDSKWLKQEILDPIHQRLRREKIVRTASGDLASILSDDGESDLWFPYGGDQELRKKIWRSASDWFPEQLPREADVELWHNVCWADCKKLTVSQLAKFVEEDVSLDALTEELGQRINVFAWLNQFYALLKSAGAEYDTIINKRKIIPNQKGTFCRKSELYRDSGDIGDEFKDILENLDNDLRSELAADGLDIEFETKAVRNRAHAVKEIAAEVNEKAENRKGAKKYSEAFRRLLRYFLKEPVQAQKLFPDLYNKRHYLYDDEEIAKNIDKAEQLTNLLAEFEVADVAALRELVARGSDSKKSLLPVTEKILVSMGIKSPEEWVAALEDKDLKELFDHESVPTREMFMYAQALVENTKARIIAYLKTQPEYDLSQMDMTATTVLAGVRKHGQPINIVVRPAQGGEVIVFYSSERDVLDYVDSELWVDDGTESRRITLGHILKKAEIKKFPV